MGDKRKKTQKASEEGPHGVDRWTSNGYGIVIGGKKVVPPDSEDEIEVSDDKTDKIKSMNN